MKITLEFTEVTEEKPSFNKDVFLIYRRTGTNFGTHKKEIGRGHLKKTDAMGDHYYIENQTSWTNVVYAWADIPTV